MTTPGHSAMAQPQKEARKQELKAQLKDQAKKNADSGGKETGEAKELPPGILSDPFADPGHGLGCVLDVVNSKLQVLAHGCMSGRRPPGASDPRRNDRSWPNSSLELGSLSTPSDVYPRVDCHLPPERPQHTISPALAPDLFPFACTSTAPLIGLPATLVVAESLTLPSEELSPWTVPQVHY